MIGIPELFPHFHEYNISVGDAVLYVRVGGAGPPLLLLHGYPQNHAMWSGIAPTLSESFTTIVPDLRGYGRSSAPPSKHGAAYAKRAMSEDMLALMRTLGHRRFRVAGHDRGARVAYRLALDHPQAIAKIAVLDIVPTGEMWDTMDASRAMKIYHWTFLAQPEPLPETLISRAWRDYIDHTLASWTAGGSLAPFAVEALESYRAAFADPARIHAMCEDYRAGATLDRVADQANLEAGVKIAAPLLALWGDHGIPAAGGDPLDVWRRWAHDVRGHGVACGHFLPEEAPEATLAALQAFFA